MYLDFGPNSFSKALYETDRDKILSEFVKRRRNREVMTGLALNSCSPIEVTEFVANRPALVLQYGNFKAKVVDGFKRKKKHALSVGEFLTKQDPELLSSFEQATIYDYLYLTGQRERCIKEEP
jgi:hypothetical protein